MYSRTRRMRLIVVRHAQSENNLAAIHLPRDIYEAGLIADPHLTSIGHEQAHRLGEHLATTFNESTPVTVRTSPMLRTLQTAQPFLTLRRLNSALWNEIHEHGGLYHGVPSLGTAIGAPGITRAQLLAHYPTFAPEDHHDDRGWWGRDVETEEEYVARVEAVAEKLFQIAETTTEGALVLVSHGTFLNSLIRQLLGIDTASEEKFLHHNGAFSELTLVDGGAELTRFDITDHLSGELLTR